MRLEEIKNEVAVGYYSAHPEYVDVDFNNIEDTLAIALESAAESCLQIDIAIEMLNELCKEIALKSDIEPIIQVLERKAWFEASNACDKIEEVL